MRAGVAPVTALFAAFVACSGASRLSSMDHAPLPAATADGGGASDAAYFRDVAIEARVASAETAWLTAHLADGPDRANPRDSDAVRRLAQMGPEGVLAVAEVFRVRDTRRMPFARRVIERVALRRCLRDHDRAAWVIASLERAERPAAVGDAGIVWQTSDDAWSGEAVERVRAWARGGTPCDAPTGGDGGIGPDAASLDAEP